MPKSFRPIVLLNTLGKLIKNVIGNRLQFHTIFNDFIYWSQLGGFKFKSTTDIDIALRHIIYSGWVKNLSTNTLEFDIAQFFPSLNHCFLSLILEKTRFNQQVVKFFLSNLIGRKMHYFWNSFILPSFDINVGVGQGSALSPILLALYLLPFFHILENCLKILKIPISTLSFIDNGLLIAQSKYLYLSNSNLYFSYNIMSNLLSKFGLIVEHLKIEVFHFSRLHGSSNFPLLNLSLIGGPILHPKDSWRYLGFFFDKKLLFHQYIDYYSNKVISTVKCMKILGNSVWGLNLHQKCLLYWSCVLPIALYRL